MAKRADGEGHPRLRKDGRWEVRVRLPDGRRPSVYGRTQRMALEAAADLKRRVQQGLSIGKVTDRMDAYMAGWLASIVGTVRPTTIASYESLTRLHIVPVIGRVQVGKVTIAHVEAVQRRAFDAGLSNNSVIRLRTVLQRALRRAVHDRLLPINPVPLVDPPKGEQKRYRWLDTDEVARLVDVTEDLRIGPMIAVALFTGLRIGEQFALRWEDVDLSSGWLHVRHTLARHKGVGVVLAPPKSRAAVRSVPLIPEAVHALNAWRRNWQVLNTAGLIFTTEAGQPMRPDVLIHAFQKTLAEYGFPRIRWHDQRHSFASMLLALGVSMKEISEILGHSGISVTMNIYAHVDPKQKQEALGKLSAEMASKKLVGVRAGVG